MNKKHGKKLTWKEAMELVSKIHEDCEKGYIEDCKREAEYLRWYYPEYDE